MLNPTLRLRHNHAATFPVRYSTPTRAFATSNTAYTAGISFMHHAAHKMTHPQRYQTGYSRGSGPARPPAVISAEPQRGNTAGARTPPNTVPPPASPNASSAAHSVSPTASATAGTAAPQSRHQRQRGPGERRCGSRCAPAGKTHPPCCTSMRALGTAAYTAAAVASATRSRARGEDRRVAGLRDLRARVRVSRARRKVVRTVVSATLADALENIQKPCVLSTGAYEMLWGALVWPKEGGGATIRKIQDLLKHT